MTKQLIRIGSNLVLPGVRLVIDFSEKEKLWYAWMIEDNSNEISPSSIGFSDLNNAITDALCNVIKDCPGWLCANNLNIINE